MSNLAMLLKIIFQYRLAVKVNMIFYMFNLDLKVILMIMNIFLFDMLFLFFS